MEKTIKKVITPTFFLTILTGLILTLVPILVFPALKKDYAKERLIVGESGFAGLSELWHIETFEGGTGSRAGYLSGRAREFERLNPNAFILVKTLTSEELKIKLEAGEKPGLFSFGAGIGDMLTSLLTEYAGGMTALGPYAAAGAYEGGQLAVPYSAGGYVSITNPAVKTKKGESAVYGLAEYNVPPVAGIANIARAGGQYDAYEKWISGGFATLLGTQRDLCRCINRASLNKLPGVEYKYIDAYTDLVQFAGVCSGLDRAAAARAEKFIEFLTAPKSQGALVFVGLAAVDGGSYHSEPVLRDMEKALSNPKIVVRNVFTARANLLSER